MYFELKNISVHYDKVQALENVTLHLDQGEIVALIGANGAGKTSTLRAITALAKPSSGEIWFGGRRIDRLEPAAVVALGLTNVLWFVGAMTIYLAGLGFALPMAMAGALTPFPDRAGTASSLMGFTQQSGAAIVAGAIGLYLGHSAWPVAAVVATMGCVAFIIWALTRRVRAAEW